MAGIKGARRFKTQEERDQANSVRTQEWRAANPDKSRILRDREREKRKAYSPEERRYYILYSKYKLTKSDYLEMLDNQGMVCKICKKPFDFDTTSYNKYYPVIDHDHKCCPTGTSCGKCIRGIIHKNCNSALGMFDEDLNILKMAVEYLENYENER